MSRVRTVRFVSQSKIAGWNGEGVGVVVVASPAQSILTFTESGNWQSSNGSKINFSNIFRWTLAGDETVGLEHLRFGPEHPVYLFDISPRSEIEWASIEPHRCEKDVYSASLRVLESGIKMYWSIVGPKKNERIEYEYSWPGERE